jgi:hypothetical protein
MQTPFQKNNFLTFDNCIQDYPIYKELNKTQNITQYTSFVISIIERNNLKRSYIDIEKSYTSYAVCLPQGTKEEKKHCSDRDYTEFMSFFVRIISKISSNETFKVTSIPILDIDQYDYDYRFYINLALPLIIIVMFLIVILLRCRYGDHKNFNKEIRTNVTIIQKNNQINKMKKKKPILYLLFDDIFNYCKIAQNLINFKKESTNISNSQGLTYIKGLIGISFLLTFLGQIFFLLVNSLLRSFKPYEFFYSYYSFLYAFIFIGLRYSPRILFSCSGYTFSYKYINFIDKEHHYYFLKFLFLQSYKYILFIGIYLFIVYTEFPFAYQERKIPMHEIYKSLILQQEGNVFTHLLSLGIIKYTLVCSSFFNWKFNNT